MNTFKTVCAVGFAFVISSCGEGLDDRMNEIAEIGEQVSKQIEETENQYGGSGEEGMLTEAPDTDVTFSMSGYTDQTFDKVYRYQANVGDQAMFIWMTFDKNDNDEQHIAVTLDLAGIAEEGEHILDRQKNGNIFIEIDGLAFRTDAGNGTVNITSASGDYLEGTFTAENVERSQKMGEEILTAVNGEFKLPLNNMKRNM